MNFTYQIESNPISVKIYSDTQVEPVIFQPNWPNGTEWSSESEASEWAELCIASIQDATAPYAPPGPNIPAEPKPTT